MLLPMKDLLVRASKENYGVAAPNVSTELDARAVIEAAEELHAPLILDVAYRATKDIKFFGSYLTRLAEKSNVPIAINLDHGFLYEHAIDAIAAGFTSVMVDRSSEPYEVNVRDVKEIVKVAHATGVSVEAELGHVGDGANYEVDGVTALTEPSMAKKYIEETGVDCLAVAIGTAHGEYKGTPHIDFDRLVEIKKIVGPEYPLVLHGGSGSGDENLAKACKLGINKVNIFTDLMIAAKNSVADVTNYRALWATISGAIKDQIGYYIKLFGGENKAWIPENYGVKGNK
ncbi:MAG: class II fructose-bisphosphate aldolase [Clostridia bacterium]|nr:class II fructose-bisphosphate aldolase [Clostridia bacterium]